MVFCSKKCLFVVLLGLGFSSSLCAGFSFDSPAVTSLSVLAAFKRDEVLAKLGVAAAQVRLAEMYYEGRDGVPQDYQIAFSWYKKAAAQEHAGAQFSLARCYYRGEGVAQDYKEAFIWFERSALHGFTEAEYGLGEMYRDGVGTVEKNVKKSLFWLQKASDQGFYLAKRAVAELAKAADSVAS